MSRDDDTPYKRIVNKQCGGTDVVRRCEFVGVPARAAARGEQQQQQRGRRERAAPPPRLRAPHANALTSEQHTKLISTREHEDYRPDIWFA